MAEISRVEPSAESLAAIREGVTGAVAMAIATQTGREYTGQLSEQIQDIAFSRIKALKYRQPVDHFSSATIYPPNCRFFAENQDRGVMIIEEPPQYRTIFIGDPYDPYDEENIETVRIPLPYLVFVICYAKNKGRSGPLYYAGNCGVGFRTTPISSLTDQLHPPALPHCEVTGVCVPAPGPSTSSVSDLIARYMESFWQTKFVHEFKSFCIAPKGKKKRISSYKEWEKVDPLDMLTYSYSTGQGGFTLESLMRSRMGTENYSPDQLKEFSKIIEQTVSEVSSSLNSAELSRAILESTQKIVDASIKAAFPNSGLQPN